MTEHPFTPFIQILGKGRRGARDLTQDEAREAMGLILSGKVEPIQLGAFLMLMRVKEETPAEVAGFVEAARVSLQRPAALPKVDVDCASYAGKRRHLPWHLLSALLFASHGTTVLMHGVTGNTAGRMYMPQALAALGLTPSTSLADAAARVASHCWAYLPLGAFSPNLERMIQLKSLLGLRSPVHTVARMLNPFSARTSLVGIFHPGYDDTHQSAGMLLGDKNLAVFKGEGGEAERNPDSVCTVKMLREGQPMVMEWSALFAQRHLKEEALDPSRLRHVWDGSLADEYATAAVVGTTAIALVAMGRAEQPEQALAEANRLWNARNPGFLASIEE